MSKGKNSYTIQLEPNLASLYYVLKITVRQSGSQHVGSRLFPTVGKGLNYGIQVFDP